MKTPNPHLTRRQLIGYSAAASAGVALAHYAQPTGIGLAAESALPEVAGFAAPSAATAPRFRWWWPNGEIEIEEIIREVNQAADAGFGGLEIADVHHSVPRDLLDVKNFGWGSPRWCEAVEASLEQADRRGITIDITLGPSWPAALPTLTPQSHEAVSEVAHGLVELAPGTTFSAALPEPVVAPSPGVTERTLLAVHAVQIITKPIRGQIVIQRSSMLDLTSQVNDEHLDWTAPAGDNTWLLLAYWVRGSGQEAEGGPHTDPTSYVVDHFSAAGSQAVIDYWNSNIITPRVAGLLRTAGGTFFEDSLEMETHSTIWTRNLLTEFSSRMGYDLLPYLPIIIEQKEKYLYDFDDLKNMRVRDDYNQVLSDLYTEYHLIPLRDWAHSLGVQYRVQAYGLEQDSISQAGIVDVPETESLGAKNLDDYRVLASARDIAGNRILSCEAAAYLGKAYNTTWNQVLQTLGETFCGGVNQTVLHGFPYATAPGAQWPGFAAFSPYFNDAIGYSEAWGPRTPNWTHASDVAAFLSRTQHILQSGQTRYDIVFLRQKGWAQTGIGAPWATAAGIPIGWSHGFLTGSSLDLEASVVSNGRFAPTGGNYKAIIVDIDRFRGNEATINPATASKLISYAQAGLPIVLFGNWDAPEAIGLRDAATNKSAANLIAELRALPTVALAAGNDDIPLALARLGVTRDVEHASSNLKHIHRVEGNTDLYYLVNARHNPPKDKLTLIDQDVWLTAESAAAVPFELDAWTGRISPIAHYQREGNRIRVRIRLTPGQSTIVALADRVWNGASAPAVHVTETSAGQARFTADGRIEVVTDAAGVLTASLSNGRTKRVTIEPLPTSIDVTSWDVSVDDWQPVAAGSYETKHVKHQVRMDGLRPWNKVPSLTDASGVGMYSTVVTLDESWAVGSLGIHLDLGVVIDTFRVWINSQLVEERDLMDSRVDISRYARQGRNTVRVEVTSTLINRLRQYHPKVYDKATSQDYGLLGPVRVSAYGVGRVL